MCFTNDKTIKIVSFSKKPEKIMSIDEALFNQVCNNYKILTCFVVKDWNFYFSFTMAFLRSKYVWGFI